MTRDHDPATTTALADELVRMTDEDLKLQHGAGTGGEAYRNWTEDLEAQLAYRRVTTRNADRLGKILDEYGWPGVGMVGAEASRRAWLVATHADRQLDLQRRALRLMEQAVAVGDADPRQLATLRDRILINEGRRQIYGTQIAGVTQDGAPVLWPCAEPGRVPILRAGIGLPSLPGTGQPVAGTVRSAP